MNSMNSVRLEKWNIYRDTWVDYLQSNIQRCTESGDLGSVIKYRRQLRVLHDVSNGLACNLELVRCLIDPERFSYHEADPSDTKQITFVQKNLDIAQQEAVAKCLAAPHLALVQGPPGTGKTSVITEICCQVLMQNSHARILICSETHVAVDNVLEKLSDLLVNLALLRITRKPDKISPHPSVQGARNQDILREYFGELVNRFDVAPALVDRIREIFSREASQGQLEKALLQSCLPVIGITCNGLAATDYSPTNLPFDYAIIDEACKATFPEIMAPLLVANKGILVGDPHQLPPVFCQEEREIQRDKRIEKLINTNYIEKLFTDVPPQFRSFLNRQYRMTNEIGDLISRCFYQGKLENGKDRPAPGSLQWLDYATNQRYPAREGDPIFNPEEAELARRILIAEHDMCKDQVTVAVITPYAAQKKLLENLLLQERLPRFDMRVDTIDSIQGQDADFVLYSVVRTGGSMRFFGDERRLNVALSRAKKKLWIIGNGRFLQRHSIFRKIREVCG